MRKMPAFAGRTASGPDGPDRPAVLTIRMPADVYAAIKLAAHVEQTSLNLWAATELASSAKIRLEAARPDMAGEALAANDRAVSILEAFDIEVLS